MSVRAALALLALLLVGGPIAGIGSAAVNGTEPVSGPIATPLSAGATSGAAGLPHNDAGEPEQVMRATIRPEGDARWRVSVRFPLETRDDTAAFEDLAARFEQGETETLALDTFEEAAARSSTESGRSMRIRDVSRSHRIENDTGVLVLSFTWTNFAETSGDRLIVGDAFNTSAGTWLPYLNERQTLLVAPPEGYGVLSSPPVAVENGVARWEGPREFSGRGPWIVYAGDIDTETSTTRSETPPPPLSETTTVPGPGPGPDPDPDGDLDLSSVLLFALVGSGLVVLAAYALRRGSDGLPGTARSPGSGSDGSSESGAGSDGSAGTDGTPTPDTPDASTAGTGEAAGGDAGATAGTGTSGAGTAAAAGAADGNESGGEDEDEDDTDVALLSDEERVERLLERNGGRMKQASIVKETGWSNAKVSQLLSAMEDQGRIDKLRIGRENLISFPDEDVTDLDPD